MCSSLRSSPSEVRRTSLLRLPAPSPAWRAVGVNGGSAPPAVPKNTPFIWRDLPSGKQLLAMWHPGGYSGFPVDSRDECVQVRWWKIVLEWCGLT